MNTQIAIPSTLRHAARELRLAFAASLHHLPKPAFLRAWCAIAYTFPGLHPDGYDDSESGRPRVLRPFAVEAWRRAEAGELADCELYPSDAQWAGIYDRMHAHEEDEIARRFQLAADYGNLTEG